jgi:nitrite reductase/ring-hydroxylating ferredoxin subunit
MPGPDAAGGARRQVLLLTGDALVRRRLERSAPGAGLELVTSRAPGDGAPGVIVFDLDAPGVADEIAGWRERCPEAFIAGHVGLPRQELWSQARRAGCDLVANRGAFAGQLVRHLPPPGRPRRRLLPLVEASELPGRIGLVLRAPDTEVGPIALFHFSGRLCAIADVCPHAGATLSEGELDGTVLTCPRHGSQFDVRDGSRRRGPADAGVPTFSAVEEDGFVCLVHE